RSVEGHRLLRRRLARRRRDLVRGRGCRGARTPCRRRPAPAPRGLGAAHRPDRRGERVRRRRRPDDRARVARRGARCTPARGRLASRLLGGGKARARDHRALHVRPGGRRGRAHAGAPAAGDSLLFRAARRGRRGIRLRMSTTVTVSLRRAAHARTGDKGNRANIGLFAYHPDLYAALAASLLAGAAAAQDDPSKPITLIVPFAAGSATDQLARSLGQQISVDAKHAVVVDNRPGANGFIAANQAAKAPADGYTVFITTNTTQAANEHLYKSLPYDPVKDFAPVTLLGKGGQVMIVNLK